MKKVKILSIIIFIGLTSCDSQSQRLQEYHSALTQFLEERGKHLNKVGREAILIVPMNSCGTCVYGTLGLMASNEKELVYTRVIVTNYSTLKPVRIKVGNSFLENVNVYKDQNALLPTYLNDIITPVYVLYEDGVPHDYIEVNSSTVAQDFESFQSWLSGQLSR